MKHVNEYIRYAICLPSSATQTGRYIKKLICSAAAVTIAIVAAAWFSPSAYAQKAAIVQSVDEPGRNPYQEALFNTTCRGLSSCTFSYSAVPVGKRLVLTHITGYVDVSDGTFPNGSVVSNLGGDAYANVHFTALRGSPAALGTRMYINEQVLAYFGPGEVPSGNLGVIGTTGTFSGGARLQLSGYFVNLP